MAQIGTRKLKLFVGGTINTTTGVVTGGTEYTVDVSQVQIESEEADRDFISFADAAAGGGRDYKLVITMVQDPASTALWDKIWTAAGTEVPFIMKPYGDVAASPTQPWFTGVAVVAEPDGVLVGGEADASATAKFVSEVEWPMTGRPYKITT